VPLPASEVIVSELWDFGAKKSRTARVAVRLGGGGNEDRYKEACCELAAKQLV
jgi:hypothetical protein